MPNEATTIPYNPEPCVLEVFEEFIRTREFEDPPEVDSFAGQLADDESKQCFRDLVESYSWTQELLPRNVQPNVVLAGRFRLIERLGAGGMGQVWRAEDEKIGRQVAVKVMSLIGSGAIDSEAVFERETHLLAQLKHPGIVSVLDSDRDEEHRFIVMDLVEGKSLEQILDALHKKPTSGVKDRSAADIVEAIGVDLPAGRTPLLHREDWCDGVVKIMVEVLLTLEAAHARLVVHRDLKPGNLMVTPGGQPVMLDFGLGGTIGGAPGDLTSSLFGTFRFVAPEQLSRGTSGTDIRTDIYQMGIVLYEFLTMSKCFGSEDHAELFAQIAKGDFARPRAVDKSIPRELEDICLRAIDVDPAHRYQTAMEFREAMQRFLRREPVHMDRYGPAQRFSRSFRYTMRRHRPVVLGAAAVLMAGTIAWFANEAFTETVTVEAMRVTPDNQLEFPLELEQPQWGVFITKFKQAGKTFYRPTRISVDGKKLAENMEPDLIDEGRHICRAEVPSEILAKGEDLQLTCSFAGEPKMFRRLQKSVRKMRADMLDGLGVDEAWMEMHWDAHVRDLDDKSPDLPLDKAFRLEGFDNGGVTVRTVTIAHAKKGK